MKPKIAAIAMLLPLALTGCVSPSGTALQPVPTLCLELPAPPAWAMVPPPSQT